MQGWFPGHFLVRCMGILMPRDSSLGWTWILCLRCPGGYLRTARNFHFSSGWVSSTSGAGLVYS